MPMTLWLLLAALSSLALGLIVLPLLRRHRAGSARADFDIEVYLDQLRELERDTARGIISAVDAESARTEIERRMLAADRSRTSGGFGPTGHRHPAIAIGLALAVPAAALAIYTQLGSPTLPDEPFAARTATPEDDPVARADARIAEAEAVARANPDNPRSWYDLGRIRFLAHRWNEAAEAFAEAARLAPSESDFAAAWGEALVFATNGTVTPPARAALAEALKRDPKNPRARYYTALAAEQDGRLAEALQGLVALLHDSPADAPWRDRVTERARALATKTGADVDRLIGAPAPPSGEAADAPAVETAPRGPNAGDIAAAQNMTPEERQAMIRTMVEGLAARLADTPDDVAGWRRLGKAWSVLGEHGKASDAYGRALEVAPADRETLFNGAVAASDAGDTATALDRFDRLRALIPPASDAYKAVERTIEELKAKAGTTRGN